MKKLFLICLLITIHCSLFAQSWVWGKEAVPGDNFSFGEPGGTHSITTDAKGNTLMTGCFHDTITFGSFKLGEYDTNSIMGEGLFLVKSDSDGNVQWARQSVQPSFYSDATGSSVITDKQGNIYVTGMFTDTISIGSISLHNPGDNMFLAKYSPAGNVIWAKQFNGRGGFAQPFPTDMAKDKWGSLYVSGELYDSVVFGPFILSSYSNNVSTEVSFLVKFDTNGNPVWARQGSVSSPHSQNFGVSVAGDNSGNIYLVGAFNDTVAFGTFSLYNKGTRDSYLVKYDTGGNVIWASQSTTVIDSGFCVPSSVSTDQNGNCYITGQAYGTVHFDTCLFSDNDVGNMFVVKYNSLGKAMWLMQSNNLSSATWAGSSIRIDTLKQCVGVISINSDFASAPFRVKIGTDTLTYSNATNSASIVLEFDSAGKVLCYNMFSEGDEDDGDAIALSGQGTRLFLEGDIANKAVFGNDTLKYGFDCPFIACWQPCTSQSDTVPYYGPPEPCNGSLFIPTAFSPNNDGQNDILYVRGDCINTMDFVVFDRWGNKVFESESKSVGWDGRYAGKPMNTGTYVWYLKATLNDGSTVEKKGNVALVR